MDNEERTTRFYKRLLLAGASITSLTTMFVTIRRQVDASNKIPLKDMMRGRDPRAVAYLYSTGALGTATLLTTLAGFGVMTGIWSYMGVTNVGRDAEQPRGMLRAIASLNVPSARSTAVP